MKALTVALNEIDTFYKREQYPVEASCPTDWHPLVKVIETMTDGTPWMGFDVKITQIPIIHPVYFMGARVRDARCGMLYSAELTGKQGMFKIVFHEAYDDYRQRKGQFQIEARATSSEMLGLVFVALKTSI